MKWTFEKSSASKWSAGDCPVRGKRKSQFQLIRTQKTIWNFASRFWQMELASAVCGLGGGFSQMSWKANEQELALPWRVGWLDWHRWRTSDVVGQSWAGWLGWCRWRAVMGQWERGLMCSLTMATRQVLSERDGFSTSLSRLPMASPSQRALYLSLDFPDGWSVERREKHSLNILPLHSIFYKKTLMSSFPQAWGKHGRNITAHMQNSLLGLCPCPLQLLLISKDLFTRYHLLASKAP